ncbi:MAG: class I SAM-dependent methyltransferase [Actinomycetota bacterium]|nr:class I SAM-dependent methyltransferase [Actinomycetota bacterium]
MTEPEHIASTRAVYDFSVAQYVGAVGTTVTAAFERPIDRAILNAFAEDCVAAGGGAVLDIGCGVGRVTSYLHGRGLDVRGIDVSPEMVTMARSAHPQLTFDVAAMTELPVGDESVAAAVYWYSIIHTPPASLPGVWAELLRVLSPGGQALMGFQAGGNEEVRREHAYGSATTLTWYRHSIDDVTASVGDAGFVVQTRIWRSAQLAHETTPQAFLAFTRPA